MLGQSGRCRRLCQTPWLWLITGLMIVALLGVQQQAKAEDANDQLIKLLEAAQLRFDADFEQISYSKQGVRTQSGWLAIEKPGKLFLRIDTPNKQTVLADGQFVWHTRFDLEQVVQQSFDKVSPFFRILATQQPDKLLQNFSVEQPLPASCNKQLFSAALQKLQLAFDVSAVKNRDRGQCFLLIWLNDEADSVQFSHIYLYFLPHENTNNLVLTAMSFESQLSATSSIYLRNIRHSPQKKTLVCLCSTARF